MESKTARGRPRAVFFVRVAMSLVRQGRGRALSAFP